MKKKRKSVKCAPVRKLDGSTRGCWYEGLQRQHRLLPSCLDCRVYFSAIEQVKYCNKVKLSEGLDKYQKTFKNI